MSLKIEDIIKITNQLRAILIENNYAWIVQQFDEEVSKGKITVKDARDIKFRPLLFENDFRRKLSDKFAVSVPYTIPEKLNLLMNSIQHIIELYSIQVEVVGFFEKQIENFKTIVFYDEGSENIEIKIENDTVLRNKEIMIDLRNYIQEIKNMMNDN